MSASWRSVSRRALADVARGPTSVLSKPATRSFASETSEPITPRTQEPEVIPPTLNYQDMSALAHAELETHREIRSLARLAVWDMPMLSTLSKPFEPPTEAVPLRWRYTTYFGELHPAANKVVVEFGITDLKHLTEAQQETLRKLAGPRRDPSTDMIKMSCETFTTQAQNKRFLGDTIAALIKEAVEGQDKFEDIPVDDRHALKRIKRKQLKAFPVAKFPREWYMTPERKAYLEAKRQSSWQDRQFYLSQKTDAAPSGDEQAARKLLQQAGLDPDKSTPEDGDKEPVLLHAVQPTGSSDRNMISGPDVIKVAQQKLAQAAATARLAAISQRRASPLTSKARSRR